MNTKQCIHPAFAAAWNAGLEVLKPTAAELEHGLELHRSLTVCEHYGFLPSGWSNKAVEDHNKGLDGRSLSDFGRRLTYLRTISMAETEQGREELVAALDQAGVHGMVVPINDYGEALVDAIQRVAAIQHLFHRFPDRLFGTGSVAGIEQAKARGATAVIFSLTGMPVFGAGDMLDPAQLLEWVDIWYSLGVRFMHLGYNRRNLFADGCTESNDGGLSELGRELVAALNRAGIVVDTPHSSRRALLEACAISKAPVISSHVGVSAVHDGPRCKSDDELKAIAETGGYVGIYSVPQLLGPNANIALMLRHLEHALKVVGPDHVVIGSDLGYGQPTPNGLKPPDGRWRRTAAGGWNRNKPLAPSSEDHLQGSLAWTNRPLLTIGLLRLGLTEEEIAKIHFGNLRRVLTQTEAVREKLQ